MERFQRPRSTPQTHGRHCQDCGKHLGPPPMARGQRLQRQDGPGPPDRAQAPRRPQRGQDQAQPERRGQDQAQPQERGQDRTVAPRRGQDRPRMGLRQDRPGARPMRHCPKCGEHLAPSRRGGIDRDRTGASRRGLMRERLLERRESLRERRQDRPSSRQGGADGVD
ncbi:MAG: hypothetical protein ISR76_00285 [Planctomycetes bacterium]|nr:hypothetical protein [Planctomycetota bacterium]